VSTQDAAVSLGNYLRTLYEAKRDNDAAAYNTALHLLLTDPVQSGHPTAVTPRMAAQAAAAADLTRGHCIPLNLPPEMAPDETESLGSKRLRLQRAIASAARALDFNQFRSALSRLENFELPPAQFTAAGCAGIAKLFPKQADCPPFDNSAPDFAHLPPSNARFTHDDATGASLTALRDFIEGKNPDTATGPANISYATLKAVVLQTHPLSRGNLQISGDVLLAHLVEEYLRADIRGGPNGDSIISPQNWVLLREQLLICIPKDKQGSLRPLGIGEFVAQLAAGVTLGLPGIRDNIKSSLNKHALGYGASGGCEAAAHAIRALLLLSPTKVAIQTDITNAFNCLSRAAIAHAIRHNAPLLAYFNARYGSDGAWAIVQQNGGLRFYVSRGVIQGDPMGTALFNVIYATILRPIEVNFPTVTIINVHDDTTIIGEPDVAFAALAALHAAIVPLGLSFNVSKFHQFSFGASAATLNDAQHRLWPQYKAGDTDADPPVEHFIPLSDGGITVAGIPVGTPAFEDTTVFAHALAIEDLTANILALKQFPTMSFTRMYQLIKMCLPSRITHLMRSISPQHALRGVARADDNVHGAMLTLLDITPEQVVANPVISDIMRLAVGKGGVGITRNVQVMPYAFAASIFLTAPLISSIVPSFAGSIATWKLARRRALGQTATDRTAGGGIAAAPEISGFPGLAKSLLDLEAIVGPIIFASLLNKFPADKSPNAQSEASAKIYETLQLSIKQRLERATPGCYDDANHFVGGASPIGNAFWLYSRDSLSIATNDVFVLATKRRLNAPLIAGGPCVCFLRSLGGNPFCYPSLSHGLRCPHSEPFLRIPRHDAINRAMVSVINTLSGAGIHAQMEVQIDSIAKFAGSHIPLDARGNANPFLRADGLITFPGTPSDASPSTRIANDSFVYDIMVSVLDVNQRSGVECIAAHKYKYNKYRGSYRNVNASNMLPICFEPSGALSPVAADAFKNMADFVSRRLGPRARHTFITTLRGRIAASIQQGQFRLLSLYLQVRAAALLCGLCNAPSASCTCPRQGRNEYTRAAQGTPTTTATAAPTLEDTLTTAPTVGDHTDVAQALLGMITEAITPPTTITTHINTGVEGMGAGE